MNAKMIIAVKYATYAVAKGKPEKKNHAYQDLILDFCDTSAALRPNRWTNYDILTFILGSEAWRNKTKEMILRRSNE